MTGLEFGLTISTSVLALLCGAFLASFLWRRDDRQERIGKAAVRAIPRLSKGGHTKLVTLAENIAVIDLSGIWNLIKQTFEEFTNTESADAYFWGVCQAEVGVALEKADRAEVLWKKLSDAIHLAPASVVLAQIDKAIKDPVKAKQLADAVAASNIVVSVETAQELLEPLLKDANKAKLIKDFVTRVAP